MFDQSSAHTNRRGGRSLAGVALSVAVHAAGGLGAIWIIQAAPAATPKVFRSALTFIAVSPMPAAPYESSPAPLVLPELRTETPAPLAAELGAVPVPSVVESKRPDVQPRLREPAPRELTPRVELPKPAPQVTVGAFADAPAPTRTLNANRQVDAAGFDAPEARAAEVKTRATAHAGFENIVAAANPRTGTDRPVGTLVADAGFGRTAVELARRVPMTRSVGEAGFGGGPADPRGLAPPLEIKPTGFGETTNPQVPARKIEPKAERIDIPVEILSKPVPAYTAEARELRLEGEVSLEVEFCASGSVRVLRIVRGLGHGLDEAASRAAQQIRFKPAQSHGRAVDVRTTVHISFRLS